MVPTRDEASDDAGMVTTGACARLTVLPFAQRHGKPFAIVHFHRHVAASAIASGSYLHAHKSQGTARREGIALGARAVPDMTYEAPPSSVMAVVTLLSDANDLRTGTSAEDLTVVMATATDVTLSGAVTIDTSHFHAYLECPRQQDAKAMPDKCCVHDRAPAHGDVHRTDSESVLWNNKNAWVLRAS